MKIFKIHPLFIVFALIYSIIGNVFLMITYICCVLLHEYAHYFVALKLGYKLDNFCLMPFGASLNLKQSILRPKDEFYIAIAGPMLNFLLVILCIALWWVFPETYSYTELFVYANMVTGVFNLLPAFPLDGSRILVSLIAIKNRRTKAIKFSLIFNYIVSALCIFLFIFSFFNEINYTYIFISIFVFVSSFDSKFSGSYNYLNLQNDKKSILKKGVGVNSLAFSSDTPIYKILRQTSKTRYNLIYIIFENEKVKIITENEFNKILLAYPVDYTIDNVLRKA